MITQIGEYVVGAYLKLKLDCDFVDYNVRFPGGGVSGLGELDVIGLDFKSSTAILCEVTTHQFLERYLTQFDLPSICLLFLKRCGSISRLMMQITQSCVILI